MKSHLFYLLCFGLFIWIPKSDAQISISTTGSAPDPSAILDIQSQDKGFLTPQMTEVQRGAITNPANGLLIYQTDGKEGFYYNDGTPQSPIWTRIGSEQNNPILKPNRIPIDSVAVFGNYLSNTVLYAITEPGSYYLTGDIDLNSTQFANSSARVLIIDADNVTLDLNGYSIIGRKGSIPDPLVFPIPSFSNSEGIDFFGPQNNITIRNGSIINCGGDGIEATSVTNSLFENLTFINNGSYALTVDDHNVVKNCISYYCGDGINSGEANYFINCQSSYSDWNGFTTNSGCQLINCVAYNNEDDGMSVSQGVLVKGCIVSENGQHGLDVNSNSTIIKCTAQGNAEDGFNISAETLVQECHAIRNGENGIRTVSNAVRILNNHCHENTLSGIYCPNARALIQGNQLTDNNDIGLFVTGNDCFVINNIATGNTDDTSNNGGNTYNPNIQVGTNSAFGPIIDVSAGGDISTITGSNHPKANFIF